VDFDELKERQAQAWSNGRFEDVAETLHDMHVALADALRPAPFERWLDVACGVGNLAELAAGGGAVVTGIDLSPRLVEVARTRAEAGGFEIAYLVGDAENLAVDDASFDVVVSSVGMIFAPDHARVASELARVTRPGGRLAFSAWTPEGSVGRMFRALAPFSPPPPEGAGSPLQWGVEAYVHERLDETFELRIERRLSRLEDESLDHAWETFSTKFGPTKTLLDTLTPERRTEYEATMKGLFADGVQPDGRVVDEREYLLVRGIRR
jgi:ubiquinone/menaquinone biosynthesis C-methylase UbiE